MQQGEGWRMGGDMQPNLEIPVNRKVCAVRTLEDNLGPLVRVMIRPPWSDMLSPGTISRGFRDENMRQSQAVGSHQGGPEEGLCWWHIFPFRWAPTVDSLHQHLQQRNHSLLDRFYSCDWNQSNVREGMLCNAIYSFQCHPLNNIQDVNPAYGSNLDSFFLLI